MANNYYPNSHPPRLNEDFRVAFDHIYSLGAEVARIKGEQANKPATSAPTVKPAESNGPSNTKLTGIAVKGTPPTHGASPFYNSASGQFEFNTAAGAVATPAHDNSPGLPGQIAFDSGFIYVCVGVNSWLRAALSSGF